MKNFVVKRVFDSIAEMDTHLVRGGTNSPVNDSGVRLCWLNDSYNFLPFLRQAATRGIMAVSGLV